MDISIFYGLGGSVVGLLVGWLIASLIHQQKLSRHDTEQQLLAQTLQQAQQSLSEQQQAKQQDEQRLRQMS